MHTFGQGTEFYAAPFDPGHAWQDELERRLPQIVDVGGHERYGHGNNPVKLADVPRKQGAMDWYLDPTAVEDRRADAEAIACGMASEQVVLLLEIAPCGGVRCERAAIPGFVTEYDAKVNACMCAVARKHEHARPERSYVAYLAASPRRSEDAQWPRDLGLADRRQRGSPGRHGAVVPARPHIGSARYRSTAPRPPGHRSVTVRPMRAIASLSLRSRRGTTSWDATGSRTRWVRPSGTAA